VTIIVAVQKDGEIAIAADTTLCFGEDKFSDANYAENKIIEAAESFIGTSGSKCIDAPLEIFIDKHIYAGALNNSHLIFDFFSGFSQFIDREFPHLHLKDEKKQLEAYFLIANPMGIFLVTHDITVIKLNQYHATGIAAEYSLGACYALYDNEEFSSTRIAEAGCLAAHQFSPTIGSKLISHTIKMK